MKSVLLSITPKYCEFIANGKKTVEVRKTKPKLDTPFKCYIYETKTKDFYSALHKKIMGKVIGEFICDEILEFDENIYGEFSMYDDELQNTCLTQFDLAKYSGGRIKLYGWEISDLKIYDTPKELSGFRQCHKCEHYFYCKAGEYSCDGVYKLTRPPQSWCYVEEVTE